MQRISEQRSEHLSLVASISAAVLAITAAFPLGRSFWPNFSFWSLFIAVLIGTILVLLIIHIREETTLAERELAISVLDKLKESTKNAINQGSEYDKEHRADFNEEIERIKQAPYKYEGAKIWLNLLYWLTLGSFISGMVGLAAAWVEKGGVSISFNLVILGLILIGSILLGYIKFGSLNLSKDENRNWQQNFAEIWNCSVNFFIAGLVAYYFVLYRWSEITNGQNITLTDFLLLLIFGMGMFGHINVLSKNITDGVEAILKRVLERK